MPDPRRSSESSIIQQNKLFLMRDWIKEALTHRAGPNSSRGRVRVVVEPSPKLVLLVKFTFACIGVLSCLEAAKYCVFGLVEL